MAAPDDEDPVGTHEDDRHVDEVMNDGTGPQGENGLVADGDGAQHQGAIVNVFEGEGEAEVEGEGEVEDEGDAEGEAEVGGDDEGEVAAARCSTPEQDDNGRAQLEKDIFGGDSDLEDEEDKDKGRHAEPALQVASSSSETDKRSEKGKEADPRERGVEEIQMMDGGEDKGVDPLEVGVDEFLMMFGSSSGDVSNFLSVVTVFR